MVKVTSTDVVCMHGMFNKIGVESNPANPSKLYLPPKNVAELLLTFIHTHRYASQGSFEPEFRAGISAPDRYGLACVNCATTLTKFAMKNIFDLFDRFAIFSLKLGVWRNRCFW